MSIYDTLYSPSFKTEEYEISPEEVAKEYVERMRKYKMALHEIRVIDKISNFLRIYKKDTSLSNSNFWRRPIAFKPPLPTPASRKRYKYTLKTEELWSNMTSGDVTINTTVYDYLPNTWTTISYK